MSALAPVRSPGVARTLGLALLGRIPIGALSLLIVLTVRHAGHSYALAGAASGTCALGMAVGGPVMGRLMDRLGQTVILLVAAAATTVAFLLFGLLPAHAPDGAYLGVALLCGLVLPPLSASVRTIWRRMLDGPAYNQVVTLDASLQELSFMIGPLVLVTAATQVGPPTVLIVTGVLWSTITVGYALLPETRAVGGSARPAHATIIGPVRDRGVRTLLVVAITIGMCIGSTELGVVTVAAEHGARALTGLLYGAWSLGSLVGGFVALRRPGHDPVRRAQALVLLLAGATALLALAPGPAVLGGLLLLAGVANAPLFGALYTVMADVAPRSMVTESFSLQTAGLTVGIAVGTSVAGVIAGAWSPSGTFLLGGAAMLAGAAYLVPGRTALRASAAGAAER